MISFICEYTSRSWTDKSETLGKLSKHRLGVPQVRNTVVEVKPNVWEIYNSKTVISTLQISVMLDYDKGCFMQICKGIKTNESCCCI